MNTTDTVERIVGNCRRLGHSAIVCAIALNMVAPLEGQIWSACCCYCLDERDPQGDAVAFRLAYERGAQWPGGCRHCSINGEDVLVAALPV